MKSDQVSRALVEILRRTRAMIETAEDERVLDYRGLDPHLLTIEGELTQNPDPRAAEKVEELKFHIITIARLDDPDASTDEEHLRRVEEIIEDLGGLQGV